MFGAAFCDQGLELRVLRRAERRLRRREAPPGGTRPRDRCTPCRTRPLAAIAVRLSCHAFAVGFAVVAGGHLRRHAQLLREVLRPISGAHDGRASCPCRTPSRRTFVPFVRGHRASGAVGRVRLIEDRRRCCASGRSGRRRGRRGRSGRGGSGSRVGGLCGIGALVPFRAGADERGGARAAAEVRRRKRRVIGASNEFL